MWCSTVVNLGMQIGAVDKQQTILTVLTFEEMESQGGQNGESYNITYVII